MPKAYYNYFLIQLWTAVSKINNKHSNTNCAGSVKTKVQSPHPKPNKVRDRLLFYRLLSFISSRITNYYSRYKNFLVWKKQLYINNMKQENIMKNICWNYQQHGKVQTEHQDKDKHTHNSVLATFKWHEEKEPIIPLCKPPLYVLM